MKYKKNYYGTHEDYDDEEYAELRAGQKRRPIRNWTRAYTQNRDEVEVIDDFYSNRKSYR